MEVSRWLAMVMRPDVAIVIYEQVSCQVDVRRQMRLQCEGFFMIVREGFLFPRTSTVHFSSDTTGNQTPIWSLTYSRASALCLQ